MPHDRDLPTDDSMGNGRSRMVDAAVACMSSAQRLSLVIGATATLFEIDAMLKTMERAAPTFGGPEALEFQFLMLVETRQQLLRPKSSSRATYETRDAYRRFIHSLNGVETNRYLHVILREEGRLDELPRLLGDFGRWMAQEYPAEVNHE